MAHDLFGVVLQGIHNVFIVIPQFIITGLSSIIFAILDPDTSILDSPGRHPAHPGAVPGVSVGSTTGDSSISNGTSSLRPRAEGEVATRSADSVAVIFRFVPLSFKVGWTRESLFVFLFDT